MIGVLYGSGTMTEDKEYKERPESKRPKMPRSQRAKQFAPFDALSGLGEILKQAEEEHRQQIEARTVIRR